LCLGTMLLRSKIAFAQVRGPSVPNVQPKGFNSVTARKDDRNNSAAPA
jgi:hypothetical protein